MFVCVWNLQLSGRLYIHLFIYDDCIILSLYTVYEDRFAVGIFPLPGFCSPFLPSGHSLLNSRDRYEQPSLPCILFIYVLAPTNNGCLL